MNLEVTAVTEPPKRDASDWAVLALVAGGFVASWAYVFMHPSDTAYGICVGGVGTFGGLFHFLTMHDDKIPDRKEQ
jgi:hypothetical protein